MQFIRFIIPPKNNQRILKVFFVILFITQLVFPFYTWGFSQSSPDYTTEIAAALILLSDSKNANFYSIAVDPSENTYMVGELDNKAKIAKFNSVGESDESIVSPGETTGFLSIAMDSSKNIYAAGFIRGRYSYDFGNDVTEKGGSNNSNLVLVKYDSSGSAQWATSASWGDSSKFYSVAVDSNGNIYAAGYIKGKYSYNFGNNVTVTGVSDGNNFVLVKYDSGGNAQWASSPSEGGSSLINSISVDSSGNIYAVGIVNETTSYNFGNSVTVVIGSNSGKNAVLIKYDTNGNAQWATSTTGDNSSDFNSVAVDSSGNIYAAGYIQGTSTYDFGNNVTATGSHVAQNSILVQYDSSGNAQWIKTTNQGSSQNNSVIVDSINNIYVGGFISGTSTYDFGDNITLQGSNSDRNSYFVKYNSSGTAQEAKVFTSTSVESLAIISGNLYILSKGTESSGDVTNFYSKNGYSLFKYGNNSPIYLFSDNVSRTGDIGDRSTTSSICNSASNKPSSCSNSAVAVVSYSGDTIADLAPSNLIVKNQDGSQTVASSWSNFSSGNLEMSLDSAGGIFSITNQEFYTGADSNGGYDTTNNCNGWTSNLGSDGGTTGISSATSSVLTNNGWECLQSFPLLCACW